MSSLQQSVKISLEVLPALLEWLMRKTGCSLEEQHTETKGQVRKGTNCSRNCGAGGLLPGETQHLRPRDTLWQCGTFPLLILCKGGSSCRTDGSSKNHKGTIAVETIAELRTMRFWSLSSKDHRLCPVRVPLALRV